MRICSVSAAILFCLSLQLRGYGQDKPVVTDADKEISGLIDNLQQIAEGDVGYMPTMSGSGFLPLGISRTGTLLLGQKAPNGSDTMRQLVVRGAAAIPLLITHLNDKRETKMKLEHQSVFGGMFFEDEYDFNRAIVKAKPPGVNRDMLGRDEEHPSQHTVTVGDLCFVALGQIVNRHFNAVRYQPTACIMINSPTYSERLRKAITTEWGALTPAQHKLSLISDFNQPDFEARRIGAAIRLGYYYPEDLESLVLRQLAEPLSDVSKVSDLVRDKLYPAKDVSQRKAIFDAFIAQAGEQNRAEILDQLFGDLDLQEADEEGRLTPRLAPRHKARECLIELFGYAKDIKSEAKPVFVPATETSQARFINAIANFPSPNIDSAIRKVLHATEDDYLARACVRYLVGRGADDDIRGYVKKRLPTASGDRRAELERLLDQLGWTPLHVAAAVYEDERIPDLVLKGANVNARAQNGKTPLHVAAEHGSFGGLQVLIKQKAELNLQDKDGKTPIQLGLPYESAVEILLEAGAEIPDILVAAFAGREDLVLGFLEKDKRLVSIRSKGGETPLHYAARRGHLKVAQVLVAGGADVNARDNDKNRMTPLHWAAIYGHHEVIVLLLAHQADRTVKDWSGKTPLNRASDAESIRILEKP